MPFQIVQARRQGFRPIIGMPGKSGTGKTESALRLARGMVGPKGRITVVDTEEGRARLFAPRTEGDLDAPAGPYFIVDLGPPFSSERCLEAYEAAEAASDIVIFDSISHEWNGEGGCLESLEKILDRMVEHDKSSTPEWTKRDKHKMRAWNEVGIAHNKFVLKLTRSKVPVIACFRAKDKVVMEKEEGKKTKIETDEDAPVQRKDLIHEMTVVFAMEARQDGGGYFTLRKRGPESLARVILGVGDRITAAHGEAIVKWCQDGQAPGQQQSTLKSAVSSIKLIKKQLWDLTADVHQGNKAGLEQWLIDETILSDTETLEELPETRLAEVLAKAKEKLHVKA